MDEYIKRKDVKKAIRCKGENLIFHKGKLFIPFNVVRSAIENAPAADVVPKSEVEKLTNKFECFLCHVTGSRLSKHTYDLATMETVATDCINETYNDGYGEGYKDCAVEIFAEIENWFELYSEREYSFAEEETAKEHYPEAEAHDYALDIINDLRTLCVAELKNTRRERHNGICDICFIGNMPSLVYVHKE